MKLKIYTDGGARGNPGPAAIGIYVENEAGEMVYEGSQYLGETTNNVAEYKALLASIKWLTEADLPDLQSVEWYLDSMLVVQQVQRNWKIKEAHLQKLAYEIWTTLQKVTVPHSFNHVPRAQNKQADALVNQALDAHRS